MLPDLPERRSLARSQRILINNPDYYQNIDIELDALVSSVFKSGKLNIVNGNKIAKVHALA